MKPGTDIWVRAFKSDGHCYRWWDATIESVDARCVVTFSPPGGWVHQPDRRWQRDVHIRAYYWFERPYILLELYTPRETLVELYAHINSPPRWVDGELHYTDYELDVAWRPGQEPRIIDEDEFEEAIHRYGYSPAFQTACYRHAHEALELVRGWRSER